MLRYSDIENLPPNHPLVKQFSKECDDHQTLMEALTESMCDELHDEQSLSYLNKYVAGDR